MPTLKQMGGFGCACHGKGTIVVQCLIVLLQFEEVFELLVGNG